MTFSTAATLVSLFFFSSFAVAGIVAPPCNSAWSWSYNSLGQNPCLIVAYLWSTCSGGSFTLQSLAPGQRSYVGPSQDDSNPCECSTVAYSLLSACGGCQGGTWLTWSEYVTNCTTTEPPGQFPIPIPAGTGVPQWALLDVTNENLWNVNQSYAVGDKPEIAPGVLLGPSGTSNSSSTGPTSSSTSSNSATPVPIRSHSSNTGAIAGGVVGGIAAISVSIAALFYCRRGRHSQTPPAPTTISERPSGFNSGPGTISSRLDTEPSMLRFYDPNDPTTYPTYQGPSPPPIYPRSSIDVPSGPSPSSGNGPYIVASAPNSQRLGPGYSGFPEPVP